MPDPNQPNRDTPPSPSWPEPMSPMVEGATQMHEVYRTYLDGGFSEAQALYLLICALYPHRPLQPPA